MDNIIIPVIVGPTCVGKTNLSIDVALACNAEVIACDSRQVYIGMDIGTAKTPFYIRQIVQHHLIDIVYPDEEFNAQNWSTLALKKIKEINERKRIPLIVGGTGFYLKALKEGLFPLPELSSEEKKNIQHKIDEIAKNKGLFNFLKKIDPKSSTVIHPNDDYRLRRAIEVYLISSKPLSYHKERVINTKRKINIFYIGLTMPRKELYMRINKRVDEMVEKGFIEEVNNLLSIGYEENLLSFQAPGYKEFIDLLKGKLSLKDAIMKTKSRTRNYAKRQITWFKKMKDIKWFDISRGFRTTLKNVVDLISMI